MNAKTAKIENKVQGTHCRWYPKFLQKSYNFNKWILFAMLRISQHNMKSNLHHPDLTGEKQDDQINQI
jgi:hypothetical protein